MSDICERLGERLSEARTFQEAVLVSEGTLADAKAVIEWLRGENGRFRDNLNLAVEAKCEMGQERAKLEAQRNAAWRALDAADKELASLGYTFVTEGLAGGKPREVILHALAPRAEQASKEVG